MPLPNEVKAPRMWPTTAKKSVFLAGSIEMGAAEKWQDKAAQQLVDLGFLVLNPRRDDWDSSWKQDVQNPQFNEQVTWEMNALEEADAIVFYFDPATKSPISLLELGLHAADDNVVVCCPEGFWKRGNVELVCTRYGIPFVKTLDEATRIVHLLLTKNPCECYGR